MNEKIDVFQELPKFVNTKSEMEKIFEFYTGEKKGSNGLYHCPFGYHKDNIPSLGITQNKYGPYFHCFTCGSSGDIVKAISLYYQIPPVEAAKRIIKDFGYPIILDKELTDEEKRQLVISKKREAWKKALEEKEESENKKIENLYRDLHRLLFKYSKSNNKELKDLYIKENIILEYNMKLFNENKQQYRKTREKEIKYYERLFWTYYGKDANYNSYAG